LTDVSGCAAATLTNVNAARRERRKRGIKARE
jgi:hypothetical protein